MVEALVNRVYPMRVGIVALLHESNTFINQRTALAHFQQDTLLTGEAVRDRFAEAAHEIGGFFSGLQAADLEAVPLLAARAIPFGPIETETFQTLLRMIDAELQQAGRLDGLLVAPHGATVCESIPDADGYWLHHLRQFVGDDVPIMGTLDAHANLSPLMVGSTDALIAYRTNPHVDQRERGLEAADLMIRTLRGEVHPGQHAEFPPLAINIERQSTDLPALAQVYRLADRQRQSPATLSNSILLGFPYADVPEMGSAVIVVSDNDHELAADQARGLADCLWQHRGEYEGRLISVDEALRQAKDAVGPICLLDMGDNVGGGSPGDSTHLAHAIARHDIGHALVCICDPQSVQQAESAGIGAELEMQIGGKTDTLHGDPFISSFRVAGLVDGQFSETETRHGGFTRFDQGRSAVVHETRAGGLTILVTSNRVPPFSLAQLTSCRIDPQDFHILVAKGVNAPVAAYAAVCTRFVRVNTPGCTTAEMQSLTYHNRRRPLFPFENSGEQCQHRSTQP